MVLPDAPSSRHATARTHESRISVNASPKDDFEDGGSLVVRLEIGGEALTKIAVCVHTRGVVGSQIEDVIIAHDEEIEDAI